VWETTARQLTKGEWKFRVASKIHFILAGLASRNLKTLATITGLQEGGNANKSIKHSEDFDKKKSNVNTWVVL
jgi:hypothetical protein